MAELSTFGMGVLALLAVWKFMLLPAIQDTFKDSLFDVRDTLRCHFAERGQLGTKAYEDLRDSLNAYIRFVEVANLALTFQFAVQLGQHPKVAERYFEELDRRFDVKDPVLARMTRMSRLRCSRIIQLYVFHSSLISLSGIYLVLLPLACAHSLFALCRKSAFRSWNSLRASVSRYMKDKEDRAIEPSHTKLFSQVNILQLT